MTIQIGMIVYKLGAFWSGIPYVWGMTAGQAGAWLYTTGNTNDKYRIIAVTIIQVL